MTHPIYPDYMLDPDAVVSVPHDSQSRPLWKWPVTDEMGVERPKTRRHGATVVLQTIE